MNPGEQSQYQWKSVPHRSLRRHSSAVWKYGGKGQGAPVPWSSGSCNLCYQRGTAKIMHLGQSKAQQTPPDYNSSLEHDPLLEEGQQMEHIYCSSSQI